MTSDVLDKRWMFPLHCVGSVGHCVVWGWRYRPFWKDFGVSHHSVEISPSGGSQGSLSWLLLTLHILHHAFWGGVVQSAETPRSISTPIDRAGFATGAVKALSMGKAAGVGFAPGRSSLCLWSLSLAWIHRWSSEAMGSVRWAVRIPLVTLPKEELEGHQRTAELGFTRMKRKRMEGMPQKKKKKT